MKQRGMSQRMLALRAGVSHSSVSRLLSGDRSPSLPTALALLRVLANEPLALAHPRRKGSQLGLAVAPAG